MPGLRRTLGFGALTFYGVGIILGAGIYSLLGEAAGLAGVSVWVAFLLASVAALLTGLSYAELATMYPSAGAEYVYLGQAWPRATWLRGMVGWALVTASVATAATVSLAFAGYASLFVGVPAAWIAIGLLVAVGLVNVIGVQEAAWANALFTVIEASGLVALIVVGMKTPGFNEVFLAAPSSGVFAAAGLIFFAYLGFEDIANLAEEAKNPSRDLPRAFLAAVVISTTLYVLAAAASVTLLEPAKLAESRSPLADAMRTQAPSLAGALGGVALFATANTALITVMAASRLLYGMARGGDAPGFLAGTLPRRMTPAFGIGLVCIAAASFLPLGRVSAVGSVASLLALSAFVCVNAALIRLRFSGHTQTRPFRVPGSVRRWPILPTLGLIVCAMLMTQFGWTTYAIGAGALLFGLAMERVPWTRATERNV